MTATLDRLLHDAEDADSGLSMAHVMRDTDAVRRFTEQRASLLRMALALDPEQTADEWDDLRWSRERAKELSALIPLARPHGEQ